MRSHCVKELFGVLSPPSPQQLFAEASKKLECIFLVNTLSRTHFWEQFSKNDSKKCGLFNNSWHTNSDVVSFRFPDTLNQ